MKSSIIRQSENCNPMRTPENEKMESAIFLGRHPDQIEHQHRPDLRPRSKRPNSATASLNVIRPRSGEVQCDA